MLAPWALAVLAIILVALFIWLLLGERRARLEADRRARSAVVKSQNLAADSEKLYPAPVVIPATSTGPAALKTDLEPVAAHVETPGVTLAEPAAPEPVDAIPISQAAEIRMDDLEIIEGIGPKISGILHDAGIHTFDQLSATDPTRILEILHAGGIRLADPRTWPEQARLAAAGDQAGLRALQDRLKGGREVA